MAHHTESKFADAADYTEACCGPELPHDTAEDVFLDARLRVKLPPEVAAQVALLNWWSLEVFREFWKRVGRAGARPRGKPILRG
jgi:hypothetical protein